MANQYDLAIHIAGKVDPSLANSAKKASGLISSIVKAELITAGIKTAANALKNFVSDAVQSYASFEQSLANAGAIAGATGQDLQDLKNAAMEAGRTTAFTAAQSADALGYMALAGWDTKTSIQALQPVLKMAQATGADLAATSDAVTDSMSAMGIPVSELNSYLDVLIQTNNKANTTAAQLMDAMLGAGSAAKAAGMDYKQTATALGILANNGVKGAEAGTALNSMLMRMTSNDKALKQYEDLGVKVFDATGKIRNFEDILKDTDKALSKLNDEDRAAAIKEIAGVNYGGQFQFLLKGVRAADDGSTEWEKLATNIDNAGGALERMNAQTTNTLTGAWTRFQSAIDGARIALLDQFGGDMAQVLNFLADTVLPKVTNAIGWLAQKVAKVIQFGKDFYNAFISIGSAATDASGASRGFGGALDFINKYGYKTYTVIQTVITVIKKMAAGFAWITDVKARMQDLNNFIEKHKDALEYAAIAVAGLGAAVLAYNAKAIAGAAAQGIMSIAVGIYTGTISAATIATSAFGAVMAFITSPITLVIAAITGLVLAGVWLYKNWDLVKAKCIELYNTVKNYFIQIYNSSALVRMFADAIKAYIDFVISFWKGAFEGLVSFCTGVWDVIKGQFDVFVTHVTFIFDNVKQIFTGLIDFVTGVFSGNWSQAWSGIVQAFGGIFGTLKGIAAAPINGIISLINKAIDGMNSLKVPDWVPGAGGMGINIPHIPEIALAKGGIATGPTTALIGEGKEAEAVLPLSKLDQLLRREQGATKNDFADYLNRNSSTANYAGDTVTFAPVINLTGNQSQASIKNAVDEAFIQFKQMYEQLKRDERRRSFARV